MVELLPFIAGLVLLLLGVRSWWRRPRRWTSDGRVHRVMCALVVGAIGFNIVVLISIGLVDPSAVGGRAWVKGVGWILATIASGCFSIWPVAWRVAGTVPPPASVLWGASACVLMGTCRLTGMLVNLASGVVDVPLDGLLLLFGGLSVLERSNGWRICVTALWGLVGLGGIVGMGAALAGSTPVLQTGTSAIDNRGLVALFGAVAALAGLTLAALLGGSAARAWCAGLADTACGGCGYDLGGREQGKCPECGGLCGRA